MPSKPFQQLMMDDEGNIRIPQGGLGDVNWGNQVVDKFDAGRRRDYFDALRDPAQVKNAAIAGAPTPSGVGKLPGFKGMSGIMRSLMLGNEAQGRDTRVGPFGFSQNKPSTANAFTETAQRYLPADPNIALDALKGLAPKTRKR